MKNFILILFVILFSNNIFSQEICDKNVETIYGNPYKVSENDNFPFMISLGLKMEIACITKDAKIENLFEKQSSELLTKYISLGMPWDENKKPRYCLAKYPFENNPSNFDKYTNCEEKRLDDLNLQHSNELRVLFYSLIN